jgi:hypothetical protein
LNVVIVAQKLKKKIEEVPLSKSISEPQLPHYSPVD